MVMSILISLELTDHDVIQEEELNFIQVLLLGRSRCSYSIKEKWDLVQEDSTLVADGVSVRQACFMIGLSCQYYSHFKKAIKTADDSEKCDAFIHYKINGTAQKLHPGCPNVLAIIRNNLNHFVFETREQGIQFSTHIVQHEACHLLPVFRENPSMQGRRPFFALQKQ